MIRSLYLLGGLFAMALILFAQGFDLAPNRPSGATAPARAAAPEAAAAPDPATAIDDLAAWPVAAGR